MGPRTPGSGVVVVRVEHACRLRRVKVQIVTAEAPARPGSMDSLGVDTVPRTPRVGPSHELRKGLSLIPAVQGPRFPARRRQASRALHSPQTRKGSGFAALSWGDPGHVPPSLQDTLPLHGRNWGCGSQRAGTPHCRLPAAPSQEGLLLTKPAFRDGRGQPAASGTRQPTWPRQAS